MHLSTSVFIRCLLGLILGLYFFSQHIFHSRGSTAREWVASTRRVSRIRKYKHIIWLFILHLGDWWETILKMTCVIVDNNIMRNRRDFVPLAELLFGIYYFPENSYLHLQVFNTHPSYWIPDLWLDPLTLDPNFTKLQLIHLSELSGCLVKLNNTLLLFYNVCQMWYVTIYPVTE